LNNLLNKTFLSLRIYSDIRVVRLLFLGFSSGLPILLIFSTLSLWLKSAGIDKSTITLFSWAGLSYGFKFMWAPLIDKLSVPYFSKKFGHRKSWLFFSQLILVFAIINVGFVDPSLNLILMALSITLIGFASATQDILIDAYRIESAPDDLQAAMSSFYIIGYRIGMIISGAGSLYLVSILGGDTGNYNVSSWQNTYLIMGTIQIIGIITCFLSPEPDLKRDLINNNLEKLKLLTTFFLGIFFMVIIYTNFPDLNLKDKFFIALLQLCRFLISLIGPIVIFLILVKFKFIKKSTITETFFSPLEKFFQNNKSSMIYLLLIISLYRIADIVLGVVANLFYSDLGYTLVQIATYSKFWGLLATILGGLLGGMMAFKTNIYVTLLTGAILAASSNLLFAVLSAFEPNSILLLSVIIADNLSGGLASTAFVAFLSSITMKKFTATQFALFTSIMLFIPKIIGGYSGAIIDTLGYDFFFVITALMGTPVIFLIVYLKKYFKVFKL
jgi:PAT family beta-lactamase induction signal transducer AmpG